MQEHRNKAAFRLAIKHYWQETMRNWKFSVPALLLPGLGSTLVFYVPPLIVAQMIEKYKDGIPSLTAALPYLFTIGGVWLLGEVIWRVTIYFMIKAEVKGVENLYISSFRHLLAKDLSFYHENFAGSLTKKTLGYANRYIDIFDATSFNIMSQILPIFFVSFVLWQFSPWLVLALLAWVAFAIAVATPMILYRKKLVDKREAAYNKVSGHISDVYGNIDAVRSFAHEKFELQKLQTLSSDHIAKMKKSWDYQNYRVDMAISPIYVATNVFGLALAIYVGERGSISIAEIFVTFSYFAGFTRVMWEFNSIYRRLETALSDAAQFTELLLDEPKVVDIASPKHFNVKEGTIEFKDVTFDHESETAGALFEKLNLQISAGEKIGLVGHSGGGKSSLMKLIMRLKDIESGQILIDGQNIAEAPQTSLRSYLSYVPQDPVMFHRTLSENIAYGKQNATDEQIKAAAKNAHADEFIQNLPKGYETLVGERGVKLSGGQRQRVAIARAMLKNAPILLLDEATSALDSESEHLIQDALWKLMEGKTAIVIAHRLSTIQKMDRILVLENGEIVEEGSHSELLKNDGIYAELWKHQSGGFLED